MKSYLLLATVILSGCVGYSEPYMSPHPYVRGHLPYDGPSKVTVVDHGPVPTGIYVRSTPSYYQRDHTSYYSPQTNYYNPYPSYGYRPYSNYGHHTNHHNYCPPTVERGHQRSYFSGSDYGYSSYRNDTKHSTYSRY